MQITKREHACLEIEIDGSRVVIDPGFFSASVDVSGVAAVVITHDHDDHVTVAHLEALRAANPGVPIFAPAAVADKVAPIDVDVVAPGDSRSAGSFTLAFVGSSRHAPIHEAFPAMENVGVVVNGELYHPGDSYDVPGLEVQALAVPLSGPWHKLSEAVDFMHAVGAPVNFAIHDEVLSAAGKSMYADILTGMAQAKGVAFSAPATGETITI